MRVIGLTGSIGMGKTTTAAIFRAAGVPTHDADQVVHRLYEGPAIAKIEAAFPGVTIGGRIDRERLAEAVVGRPEALAKLESIVHPLVRESEERFLARCRVEGRRLAVLDIPLLFETGAESRVDVIVVATADPAIQRKRVLARSGMNSEKFEALLARQVPDAEKRRRGHFLVDSGSGLAPARRQVDAIVRALVAIS